VSNVPHPAPGQVIGLLGGSFDPAHGGHVAITRAALARFGIDRVWWLVSPGNPLKSAGPAPLAERIAAARAIIAHPRVTVTGIEAVLGSRRTAQTLRALRRRYPRNRFVWLMGADNLVQFHRWQDWQDIAQQVAIGVLARPGLSMPAGLSRAARAMAGDRLPAHQSAALGRRAPPVWCFVTLPLSHASSTAIRARGGWGRPARMAGACP